MTEEITIQLPKRADLVFQIENVPNTDVWAVVNKGEYQDIVSKARKYDVLEQALGEDPLAYFEREHPRLALSQKRRVFG